MELTLGKTNYRQICTILKLIYQNPGITRKELGEKLGIDRAMVTHILKYLTSEGWLEDQDAFAKRLPLNLTPGRLYAAGVEVQPEYQEFVISDIDGVIAYKQSFKKTVTDVQTFLDTDILPLLKKVPVQISGLGVAVPGICNTESGEIYKSVPFGDNSLFMVKKVFGENVIPVFIENDVRCWGWGKVAFKKENDDFLVMVYHLIDDPDDDSKYKRISRGSALFSNGTALKGSHGCAGELPGFFRIDEYRKTKNYITYKKRLSMRQNPEVLEQFVKEAAITAGYLATVLDVHTVYITGCEKTTPSDCEKRIRNYMDQYHFYPDIQKTEVVCEKATKTTTALGAAGFVFENLFVKSCEKEIPESRLIKPKRA